MIMEIIMKWDTVQGLGLKIVPQIDHHHVMDRPLLRSLADNQ